MSKYPVVLSIAGSDSGGGAGIQADIKTLSMLGCFATTVITAVTAQNTISINHIESMSSKSVAAQCHAVLDDFDVKIIKVGMLSHEDTIRVVANILSNYSSIPIIMDPVMISQQGVALLNASTIDVLIDCLLPLATLITPNLYEAEVLSGRVISSKQHVKEAAVSLAQMMQAAILLKGGHLGTVDASDYLITATESRWFERARIDTNHTHGTGCSLSAAIAGFMAQGSCLVTAIEQAKKFIHGAIIAGIELGVGKGCGPVDHLWYFGEPG